MVRLPLLVTLIASLAGCAITEVPLGHDNPLDRIYDSGKFRMVLTAEAKSASLTQLTWSNVFHSEDGELTDAELKLNNSATILRSAVAPIAADLTAVKNQATLSGAFATVGECSVKVTGTGYAGNCDVSSVPKGYFIIQFNYRYTGKAGTVAGILYSNFVVVQ
ncbi:MAG TPA: hypothetical protein PKM44_09765 [Turneriella sp.]|nr:hypothetical protein [Turneriella sp.]HNA79205.1 hypothetical protein [Turneriella sp.]HNE20542.1 hypothetical protein [Turneriella sp.]HNJ65368.1 hypothetical protein [Turneriella sp.]HNL10787.1 hypothetical protein [Turneriella sp.]